MSQGFLVSCVPSKSKRRKDRAVRLLHYSYSAANFIKQHIDPNDENPDVSVMIFNSNGYFEREIKGKEAFTEFVRN